MNWYKTAQEKDNWIITKLVTSLGMASILGLLALRGMTMPELAREYQENPQKVVQEAKQVEQQEQYKNLAPIETEKKEQEVGNIDLDRIWQIESSRGTDPDMGRSESGARGHFQFMKPTWNEMVKLMGKDWDWWNDSMDYEKSRQVADFYFNKRIPEMLNAYNITDTIETRIGAYSWGIGYLRKTWEKYGENWLNAPPTPTETQDYVVKYKGV